MIDFVKAVTFVFRYAPKSCFLREGNAAGEDIGCPKLATKRNVQDAGCVGCLAGIRGGASRSDVVISDDPIDYPKPMALDLFIALSPAAVEQYWSEVQEGRTVVLVDRTLVPCPPDHFPPVLAIEATRIAEEEFKNRVVANMIMLGAMAAITGWVSLKALEETLNGRISARALDARRGA